MLQVSVYPIIRIADAAEKRKKPSDTFFGIAQGTNIR